MPMTEVHLAGNSSKLLRLGPRVGHRWLREDRLCVSFREHPAELMYGPDGRIWAPAGCVIAIGCEVIDAEGAWACIQEDKPMRATPVGPTRWRATDYQCVQVEWTDGADSFISAVIFATALGGVLIDYVADEIGGEYMPRDLADPDPRCVMAHIDVELGP